MQEMKSLAVVAFWPLNNKVGIKKKNIPHIKLKQVKREFFTFQANQ
jgi:hypothetical protein